ncbi:MAG: hypothetical protein AB7O24_28360 [Kofleriaceae bacterium]
MRIRALVLLSGSLAAAIGCGGSGGGGGGGSPRGFCEDLAAVSCSRSYECYTAEELSSNMFPATEQECAEIVADKQMCGETTPKTLCGDKKYRPEKAEACLEELEQLTCTEVRDPHLMPAQATPSCTQVCG